MERWLHWGVYSDGDLKSVYDSPEVALSFMNSDDDQVCPVRYEGNGLYTDLSVRLSRKELSMLLEITRKSRKRRRKR